MSGAVLIREPTSLEGHCGSRQFVEAKATTPPVIAWLNAVHRKSRVATLIPDPIRRSGT